jgi:hypothetical protein
MKISELGEGAEFLVFGVRNENKRIGKNTARDTHLRIQCRQIFGPNQTI